MSVKVFLSLTLVLVNASAMAQNYNRIGNTTYGSNGISYQQIGNTTHSSTGSTYQQIGNTTYSSSGNTYQQIGNTTYGSNGTNAQQIGNTTYINSVGGTRKTCQQIGAQTFCN
jgi:hypothetical protein